MLFHFRGVHRSLISVYSAYYFTKSTFIKWTRLSQNHAKVHRGRGGLIIQRKIEPEPELEPEIYFAYFMRTCRPPHIHLFLNKSGKASIHIIIIRSFTHFYCDLLWLAIGFQPLKANVSNAFGAVPHCSICYVRQQRICVTKIWCCTTSLAFGTTFHLLQKGRKLLHIQKYTSSAIRCLKHLFQEQLTWILTLQLCSQSHKVPPDQMKVFARNTLLVSTE